MANFEIVELDAKGVATPFGTETYPDGRIAASIIANLQLRHPGKKFQPRPVKDETRNWRVREQQRFNEGLYQPLGLDLTPIDGHFAHKAIKVPANVAYTPSPEYGQVDKQTSVHIKTYLTRFYPNLTIDQRRKMIWDYCGEDVSDGLFFAKTAEEIKHVYIHGPGSCMSDDSYYGLDGHHPSEAYASGDFEIAYLKINERITARAVVGVKDKIYYCVYGDGAKLREALHNNGFTEADYGEPWYGLRLVLIDTNGNGYVCPYLDFNSWVKVEGDYLVVCGRNDAYRIDAQNTRGCTDYSEDHDYDDDY